MAVISLENVSLKRQGKLLLNNLNWQVEKGEMWAILGLNGSGKSTLLKMIMAEYLSPGVYIEEFDSGPTPMQGV